MKNAHTFLLSIALSFTALLPMSASAQTTAEAAKPSAMAPASMTDGEVRKIDKDAGKITIKHGDIKPVSYTHLTLPTTPYV